MALLHAVWFPSQFLPVKDNRVWMRSSCPSFNSRFRFSLRPARFRIRRLGASESASKLRSYRGMNGRGKTDSDSEEEDEIPSSRPLNDPYLMDAEERKEWRQKIRQVIEMNPDVEEESDPIEIRKKMEKLLSEYPLVVNEEDPDWPENDDGWGFKLGSFFDTITINNVQKDDDDDEKYHSDNEIVWRDDNYIRPIKDITTAEWEETVFKDISPLVVLVHNRYKRPKENERVRDELDKAVNIIWNCGLPSPRCIAIDAVVENDLASALKVTFFPQLVFTKSGKILYREEEVIGKVVAQCSSALKGFDMMELASKGLPLSWWFNIRYELMDSVMFSSDFIDLKACLSRHVHREKKSLSYLRKAGN